MQKIVTAIFIVMTVLYFIQIAARYLFNTGISWSEELVVFLMVWLTYLGATVLAKEDGHISMTILEDVFPASKKFLNFLKYVAMIVYCALVSWFSVSALQVAKLQVSTAMQIPMNIIYLAIPLSMILMILHILIRIYDLFRKGEDK
jgi:TRAP-type C4-dicarboxylate transport system permease small subunit